MVAAIPPGHGDGAASIPPLRKPEVRQLSSSVSIAFLSVASNNVAVREAWIKKKIPRQKKVEALMCLEPGRQVGLRPFELVLHFFFFFLSTSSYVYRQEESEFASELRHLFVQFSPPTDSPGNLIPLIQRYLHRWKRAARAGV